MASARGKTPVRKSGAKRSAKRVAKATRKPLPSREQETQPAPFSEIHHGPAPKWNHFKQIHYVFWRMANGCTVTDALKELKLDPTIFWSIVDGNNRQSIFRAKYERAKQLQARAFADKVNIVAEGRDAISKHYLQTLEKKIGRAMRKYKKNRIEALREFISIVKYDLGDRERSLIGRNKMQIDAAKWQAKICDPSQYSERVDHTISNSENGGGEPVAIRVQFVDPNSVKIPRKKV